MNFTTRTPTRLQKKEKNIHLKTQTSALGNKKDKGSSPNTSLSQTSTKKNISSTSTRNRHLPNKYSVKTNLLAYVGQNLRGTGGSCGLQQLSRLTAEREVGFRVAWMTTKMAVKIMSLICTFRTNYLHTECRNVWFEISRKMTPTYPPHI